MASLSAFAEANPNGWSLLTVKAPFETVAKALRACPDYISSKEGAPVQLIGESENGAPTDSDGKHLTVSVHPDHRCVGLVDLADSEWTIALRSVDFAYEADTTWVRDTALRLSKKLAARALACCGECSCDLYLLDRGKPIEQRFDCDLAEASGIVADLGATIPQCLIAGDPPLLWSDAATRDGIRQASLLTMAVTAPPSPPEPRRPKLPAERMIASQCLEIVKLAQHTPFEVRSAQNDFATTVVEIVFDPLRIDEVNQRFKEAGFWFDDELLKVLAVNADGSLLLWYGIATVHHLKKGEECTRLALNDILDLTFPFRFKNRKAEINKLLAQLRELEG